jgi:hypothetical protein
MGGTIVGEAKNVRMCIVNHNWESGMSEAGDIVDVISDIGNMLCRNLFLFRDFQKSGKFVFAPMNA